MAHLQQGLAQQQQQLAQSQQMAHMQQGLAQQMAQQQSQQGLMSHPGQPMGQTMMPPQHLMSHPGPQMDQLYPVGGEAMYSAAPQQQQGMGPSGVGPPQGQAPFQGSGQPEGYGGMAMGPPTGHVGQGMALDADLMGAYDQAGAPGQQIEGGLQGGFSGQQQQQQGGTEVFALPVYSLFPWGKLDMCGSGKLSLGMRRICNLDCIGRECRPSKNSQRVLLVLVEVCFRLFITVVPCHGSNHISLRSVTCYPQYYATPFILPQGSRI